MASVSFLKSFVTRTGWLQADPNPSAEISVKMYQVTLSKSEQKEQNGYVCRVPALRCHQLFKRITHFGF